jgi:hypothetical protein
MQIIVAWFRHNTWYKLAALVVAVVAWALVSAQTDPLVDVTVPVPVAVEKPPDLAVTEVDRTDVPLSFRVRREVAERLQKQPTLLVLVADATTLSPGKGLAVPTQLMTRPRVGGERFRPLPAYILPESQAPPQVVITLERMVTKTVPVAPGWRGTAPAGLRVEGFAFEPPEVTVRGAESLVEQVETVIAPVDVSRVSLEPSQPVQVRVEPRDSSRQTVPDVEADPPVVRATPIVVAVTEKQVTVVVDHGPPPDGYEVTGATVRPSLVRIAGRTEGLRAVQSVQTERLDLSRATGTFTTTAVLRTPEGVSSMSPNTVTVTIRIRRLVPSPPPAAPAPGEGSGVGGGAGPPAEGEPGAPPEGGEPTDRPPGGGARTEGASGR